MRGKAALAIMAASAALASAAPAPARPEPARRSPLVRIDSGPIAGVTRDGMRQFLGIPYAAPPVADLRWRPPVSPKAWQTVRPANRYGSGCAQNDTSFPGFAKPSESEDCLYLNVYTPATVARRPLPVFVWIHGGGLFMGDSDDHDPSLLVKDGNVVFVAMNYRLNLFGFFSHGEINREGHPAGNYGIMDQQFALQWVQRNIARFGGDPSRVTIAGESAGGFSVWAHLVSPGSSGLFQRAIIESGSASPVVPTPSLAAREKVGADLAQAVGCGDSGAACLRATPVKALLDANRMTARTWGGGKFATGLIADGQTLPGSLDRLFADGKFARVPIINGTNRDEYRWFQAMKELVTGTPVSDADYARSVAAIFGPDNAPKLLSTYPTSQYENAGAALAAVMGDASFICGGNRRINRILQRYDPRVFMFEFDVPDSPSPWQRVSFPYRAAHTLEMPYLFPRFRGASGTAQELSPAQADLSRHMVRYWSNFAWSGTPNGHASGSPEWSAYQPAGDPFLSLRTPAPVMQTDFGVSHHCDLWDTIAAQQAAARK